MNDGLPIQAATAVLQSLAEQESTLFAAAGALVEALRAGKKVLTMGNGGSASQAQHLATELVGRYRGDRRSLPSVFLGGDASAVTCIANDFSFDDVFARPLEGLGAPGDILVCFSTSGAAMNLVRALEIAKARSIPSLALLGKDGGRAKGLATWEIIVRSTDTARVQEAHLFLLHWLCEQVERGIA